MRNLKAGDLIWAKYNGLYFVFRIVLDLDKINKEFALTRNTPFESNLFRKTYYVEIYDGVFGDLGDVDYSGLRVITCVKVASLAFNPKSFPGVQCGKLDNIFIDPTELQFCEYLIALFNNTYVFSVGEIRIETTLPFNWNDKNYQVPVTTFISISSLAISILNYVGKKSLILAKDSADMSFEDDDLRLRPKQRLQVFENIGEDPNLTYYELSLKHGFDLKRFYT